MTTPTIHESATWAACLGNDERCPEPPMEHDILPWADPYIASLVASLWELKPTPASDV
ncbi:MAG: hypothetical protein MK165_08680 [Pirellulaceae bacterium]|nr:hypothetical protein [Pirellulaceae bacterium]